MTPRPGLNQDMIVDRALQLAEEGGLSTVTMANLARSFSIKPPSLYNHFRNLHEIKQSMALKAQDMLYDHLKKSVNKEVEPVERLQEMAKHYVTFANRYPGIYEASLIAPDLNEGVYQNGEEPLVQLLQKYLEPFSLPDRETIHAIRGLRSLLHGLVDLHKKEGFKLGIEIEESRIYLVEAFLKGIEWNHK
ncbi:TetR/AcrR family transcriptional regulator [Pontibacillus salipaludis]|uniref:TetR/AcrR family transcriptional regulator n=1 Tax=Pontibacillus salipaludis TaxID=1697394 RepID=UPI0031F0EA98